MLALQGDEWIQCFGEGVESLHFHNHMEIGYCYYGEGEMMIGDQVIPFREGTCTMIPRNIPHTTKSRPGTGNIFLPMWRGWRTVYSRENGS